MSLAWLGPFFHDMWDSLNASREIRRSSFVKKYADMTLAELRHTHKTMQLGPYAGENNGHTHDKIVGNNRKGFQNGKLHSQMQDAKAAGYPSVQSYKIAAKRFRARKKLVGLWIMKREQEKQESEEIENAAARGAMNSCQAPEYDTSGIWNERIKPRGENRAINHPFNQRDVGIPQKKYGYPDFSHPFGRYVYPN